LLSSLASGNVDLSTLTELGRPAGCDSPGWRDAPYDISTLIGSYVHFNCRTSIPHTAMLWMYNGRLSNGSSSRITLSHHNTTLRYGPVSSEDNDISIGCEVMTTYGPLPSPLGRISIMGESIMKIDNKLYV